MEKERELKLEKIHDFGVELLEMLHAKSDKDLVAFIAESLKSPIGTVPSNISEIFDYDYNVKRVINNEKITEIEISFYSTIIIDPFGVFYQPEHGERKTLTDFNHMYHYFNLNKQQ